MSVMYEMLENILALTFQPFEAPTTNIFPGENYHPVFGRGAVVDQPKVLTPTIFPHHYDKETQQLNGDFSTHFINEDKYKKVFLNRKLHGYYDNNDLGKQLNSKYHKRPFRGRQGHFIDNGMNVYSRDHVSDRKPRHNPFYNYIKVSQNRK